MKPQPHPEINAAFLGIVVLLIMLCGFACGMKFRSIDARDDEQGRIAAKWTGMQYRVRKVVDQPW